MVGLTLRRFARSLSCMGCGKSGLLFSRGTQFGHRILERLAISHKMISSTSMAFNWFASSLLWFALSLLPLFLFLLWLNRIHPGHVPRGFSLHLIDKTFFLLLKVFHTLSFGLTIAASIYFNPLGHGNSLLQVSSYVGPTCSLKGGLSPAKYTENGSSSVMVGSLLFSSWNFAM